MNGRGRKEPINILIVEDNPVDVRLVTDAFRDVSVPHTLHVVNDGVAALGFLHRGGKHAGAPRPDLILLDIKLPGMDGHEVLAEIKQDPGLRRIPVVIVTSSKAEEDIIRAYDRHANCYVSKPIESEQFSTVIKSIEEFWLRTAELPSA